MERQAGGRWRGSEVDGLSEERLPNRLLSGKAVLYARVSSKEQEREGYSIPAQCKLLRSYARRHDYQIVREFIDVETAKQSGRTHFTEMIRFLEEHPQVRILLCEKTDRLYRNFKDYVTIDELDLTLIFVKEGSVLNRDSRSHEKFIHGIKVLMAKNYIDNLSEETRKGMQEKAEEGEFPAYAPLGYLHDKAKKTIEIDPERAPIIRQMFEQYATGKYSIRRLEVQAARQGLTTRKGHRVARSSVAQILKNPFYTGDFLWNGKRYQGKHPPLIDKALFDRVQAVAAQRNDTRATAHRFPYTGLLKCAACGCAITAEIKKGRYVYYHCTFDKGSCGGLYVREEELERQFEEHPRGVPVLRGPARLDAGGPAAEPEGEGGVPPPRHREAERPLRQAPEPHRPDLPGQAGWGGRGGVLPPKRLPVARGAGPGPRPDRAAREGGPELHRAGNPAPGDRAQRPTVLPEPRPG